MDLDQSSASYEARPAMLLSSLVQTRSIELVLFPVASQVSQLMILTETRGNPFPNMEPTALSVMDAVQNLADVAKKITAETSDEKLQAELPVAYNQALLAGHQLVESSRALAQEPSSREAIAVLQNAARKILEGTMKVLLVWDEAEVRKIICAAHWTLDRLELVKVAKSMRSLVICFGGLSEAMVVLLSLADKRQKDLTDRKRKEQILAALTKLKESLSPFSDAMKNYVRNPSNVPTQNLRNARANEVSSAIHKLISAVRAFGTEFTDSEPDNMVTNIMEVHRKLAPDSRYFIGPDLDHHLDLIVKNSTAVSHVSREHYRKPIMKLCSEVLALRKGLGDHLEVVTNYPESVEARTAFDQTAEQLCEKLCEIDRWVADAVVDQVTEVFVEPSAPVNHLVKAAAGSPATTSPGSSPGTSPTSSSRMSGQESDTLTRQVELFRRHSRRLSQVASHAAQSSADSKRVQLITELASQVDEVMPLVVEAALAVKRSPGDATAKSRLDAARREWAQKVQQLTAAIDDIIDPEDFMAVSEANIHREMTKCRDAVRDQNWPLLRMLTQGVAAKAKRVAEVGRMAADQAHEPWKKKTITAAVTRLENAIPQMVSLANDVISNPSHQQTQDRFAQSLKELLDSIHATQAALTSDGTATDHQPLPASTATSTPIAVPRDHKQQLQQQPLLVSPVPPCPPPPPPHSIPPETRYIGSLKRKKKSRTPATPHDETDSADLKLVTPTKTGDAQTQTPLKEYSPQLKDIEYPSALVGSTSADLRLSPTATLSPVSDTVTTTADPSQVEEQHSKKESPTHKTVQAYARPLRELVSVAKEGEADSLQLHVNALQARAIRLTGIAETAASIAGRHNTRLMKVLQTKASEVNKLTPQVIEHAEEVVRDPTRSVRLGDLQLTSHQWAGHVSQLIDATQKANYPWSKTAERLVSAAKHGEGLEAQMKHVSTQTNKMVDVAMATVTAAETEEAIGVGSGSGDDSEPPDPELQEQVKHVRVTASEIQKLTPQLLSAAEMASSQGEASATMEHLNLLSQEWATKAKVLLHGVDDVSLGMSGPADTLLLSARSGDPSLLSDQGKAITDLASSLSNIAQDALEGCNDEKKAEEVKGALERITATSAELIGCANRVAQEEGETGAQQLEDLQDTLENTELLRRDWASQVHLITAHIDGLIAKVAVPLDRLVDIALQASRTSSIAKQHLLGMFENKASFIRDQLDVVDSCFQEAVATVQESETALDSAATCISFLKKLTPHAVGACRSLASEPGSAMLEHFNHLRRQWASKAQKLVVSLQNVKAADMEEVLDAFADLLYYSKSGPNTPRRSGSLSHKSYSFEDLAEEEGTGNLVVKEPSKPKGDPRKRYSAAEEATEVSRRVIQASKRPTSMAVPLPSWSADREGMTASSQSIAVAAQSLQEVADEFQEEGNIIITVAKKMSQQMSQMAEFSHGRGELQSKTEMIHTAKAIAANGQVIVQFANIISDQCTDKRMKANLQYCAEMIPTLSTQLRIIASVKASTPDDASADVMLVKNAQNLMHAVIKTMQAAEAACMKGLKGAEDGEQTDAVNLAIHWKHKLYHQRTMEAISAPRGARGLRKLNRSHISSPSIVDIIQPKMTL